MSIDPGFLAAVADGKPPAKYVMEKAAVGFGVTVDDLTGRSRTRQLAGYRQITMAVLRRMTEASYPALGRIFNRDHSTVMHGVERAETVARLRRATDALQAEVEREWATDHGVQYSRSAYGSRYDQVVFS